MRSAVVIAVLLFVASANGLAFSKLKAQRQTVLQQQQHAHAALKSASTQHFILKTNLQTKYYGCEEIGAVKCKQLKDAAALANVKVHAMAAYLTAHGSNAHFTAAFGAAPVADVKACLDAMALDASVLKLFNAWSNKDGTAYTEPKTEDEAKRRPPETAWVGVENGTTQLQVGPLAYTWTVGEMAEHLVHEASHAFCKTADLHNGKNGYKTSRDFNLCRGATNADSYRVYAQLVTP